MSNLITNLFPFVDFLYILQLEDYNSRNYTNWISGRLFQRNLQKVGRITWTKKAFALLAVSGTLYALLTIYIATLIPNTAWLLLTFIITTFLIPYIVLLANLVFSPIDIYAKKQLLLSAKQKLASLPNLKIVAIIGSQGKTTTRQFLCQLIDGSLVFHTPPDNHNVYTAIARDILQNVTNKTKVYVVEFGELYRGDLQFLANFLQPKIIILTAVSSQHIAQFGGQAGIDQEFVSLLNHAKAQLFLNGDDAGVKRILTSIRVPYELVHAYNLDQFHKKESFPELLHPDHMQQNAALALKAAEWLGVGETDLKKRVTKLEPVSRRLNVTKKGEITIIDDSYNISPESAGKALEHLKTHTGRHIVVTGGIVDQGQNEKGSNIAFGQHIAETADVVVVAANRLAPYVKKGIGNAPKSITTIDSPHPDKTPKILQDMLKPGDVVLIQNELPDLYWH